MLACYIQSIRATSGPWTKNFYNVFESYNCYDEKIQNF